MVLSENEQYFAAFEYVRTEHNSLLPELMAVNHVDFTRKSSVEWKYLTNADTIGRSYALKAWKVISSSPTTFD